ncbi:MAG: SCO family protein [Bdellovibrionia bacterium]
MSKLILSVILVFSAQAFAGKTAPGKLANEMPPELKGIGITENLGGKVDLDLMFTDDAGKSVRLGEYFKGNRPVLLSLVYYGCPNLCNFYLNGLMESLQNLKSVPGRDFELVMVSIDPTEDAALATAKKENYRKEYKVPGEWHFLTGKEPAIKALAKQVGFGYRWDEESQQFAHTSAAIVVTPAGEISRYLTGIMFDSTTLRLSLVEASKNHIGTLLDKVILFCFRFDPHAKKYSFYAYNLMRASAGATVFLLALFLVPFWRRQRRVQHLQGDF